MHNNGKIRLLLVEDDPDAVEFFRQILQDAGYAVDTAGDGSQALSKAAASRPDLILLDLMLPGEDGFEVAKRLSACEGCGAVPIVIITALSPLEAPESRLREIENVRRCIFKPCRARTFLEAVEDVLRHA